MDEGEAFIALEGLVEQPVRLSSSRLRSLPGRVADVGVLASGFSGEAVPLRSILAAAGPLPEARYVSAISGDGYRACLPLDELAQKGLLIDRLEGRPLPVEQGGPFRLLLPQGKTRCVNVKGVRVLKLSAEAEPDSVPTNPVH